MSRGVRNLCDEMTDAVLMKNSERLAELVRQGADINMSLSAGLLPIVLAANRQDLELCQLLVKLGAQLDVSGNAGSCEVPPLGIAIQAGLDQAVAMLIKIGADFNAVVSFNGEQISMSDPFHLYPGSTALHLAVYKRNMPIIRCLVEAGADVNKADRTGNTALHLACLDRYGADETVQYLLSVNRGSRAACRRTDIDAVNRVLQTPLMFAARTSLSVTQLLLTANPPPIIDAVDKLQQTALHYAVKSGCDETVLLLLRSGCPVNELKPGAGRQRSPLHVAAKHGNSTVCELLLDFGANPLALTDDNDTVLHQAASCSNWTDPVDILQKFVDLHVDIEAENRHGSTALIAAAGSGNVVVAQYLIDIGAKLNTTRTSGHTALLLAFENCCVDIFHMLLIEGADPNVCKLRWQKSSDCHQMLYQLLLLTNAKFACRQFRSLSRLQPTGDFLNLQHSSNQETAYFVDAGLILKPRSLKDCCRMTIRDAVISHCCGTGIVRSLLRLHLPRSLHNYLCYVSEIPSSFSDVSSCSSENNDE